MTQTIRRRACPSYRRTSPDVSFENAWCARAWEDVVLVRCAHIARDTRASPRIEITRKNDVKAKHTSLSLPPSRRRARVVCASRYRVFDAFLGVPNTLERQNRRLRRQLIDAHNWWRAPPPLNSLLYKFRRKCINYIILLYNYEEFIII